MSVIVARRLTLVCAHAHLPVIFSYQERRSWEVADLESLGSMCVVVATLGSPRWWLRISFFKLRDLGGSKRDVQPSLRNCFVMAVYAPDCNKDSDVHEPSMNVTKIFWEGRRAGAKDSYISGDFDVELACTVCRR